MARSVRIEKKVQLILSLVLLTSWVTGIAFFSLNQWFMVEGEFGPEKNPWQFPILKVHGAAAFLMLIGFGYLLASHVVVSYPVKRMRTSGLSICILFSMLVFTAYGLYYVGHDTLRAILGYTHASIGLCIPFFIWYHIYRGRQLRARPGRAKKK